MDYNELKNIQWYPGHMTKAHRMLSAQMSLIDVVVELLDARIPLASRNPDIDKTARDKKRVLVLNKADLADKTTTKLWSEHFRNLGFFVLPINATDTDRKRGGLIKLSETLHKVMQDKVNRQKERGRIGIQIRAMIVGIPNVGKSTFINQLSGRVSTKTADKPGVTRGRQWIKCDGFDLLDTPGILWPKFDDPKVGLLLAATGAISDNVLDKITIANYLLPILHGIDPKIIADRYFKGKETAPTLENIGAARGFLKRGGIVDIERVAIILLDEFRGGKLGRITLEAPASSVE